MVNRRIVLDKFGSASSIYDIQPEQIKAVADAFASINPEKSGWFTGTITFRTVGGKVIEIDETRIVRTEPPEQSEQFAGSVSENDPFFASIAVLRHFEGTATPRFPDMTGKVWTPTGNAKIDKDK